VVGWDPHFNYSKLVYASACLRELPGCLFVATNLGRSLVSVQCRVLVSVQCSAAYSIQWCVAAHTGDAARSASSLAGKQADRQT